MAALNYVFDLMVSIQSFAGGDFWDLWGFMWRLWFWGRFL